MSHHSLLLLRRLVATSAISLTAAVNMAFAADNCPAYLNQALRKLRATETINICTAHAGKLLLPVNTVGHCGFTPQFNNLKALHEKYRASGLVIIGSPSDDFNQEAKNEAETAAVCYINYGVKFTMQAESPVKGSNANSIFQELVKLAAAPSWNFNKYPAKLDGTVVQHFNSRVTPESAEMPQTIDKLLLADSKAK